MDDSTNLGRGPAPQLRVGDAERQDAAAQLQGHFSAGRITWDELDERLGQAWAARTQGDLTVLFTDLPAERVAVRAPDPRPSSRVQELRHRLPVRPEFLIFALLITIAAVATEGAFLVPLAFLLVLGGRHNGRHLHHHYRHSPGGHHGMRG